MHDDGRLAVEVTGSQELPVAGLDPLSVRRCADGKLTHTERTIEVVILTTCRSRRRDSAAPRAARIQVIDNIDRASWCSAGSCCKDGCEYVSRCRDYTPVFVSCGVTHAANPILNTKPSVIARVLGCGRIRSDVVVRGVQDVRFRLPTILAQLRYRLL